MSKRPLPTSEKTIASTHRRRVLVAMGFLNHERHTGIVRYAREAGWIVDSRIFAFHGGESGREYVNSARFDGALTMMTGDAPWLPELLKSIRVPVVDLWKNYPELNYPRVLLDHAAIGKMGAEHLMMRGFQHLLFYAHAIEGGSGKMRQEGFQQAVDSAGRHFLELSWDHHQPPTGFPTRLSWLANYLSNAPKPLAVMAANDHIAGEVLEAAELANLKVPQEVAVLGVDNDPNITELTVVPLSSVDSARELVGYQAAALLDQLMDGKSPPSNPILISPRMVVTRHSTDVQAARDPDVAGALQYIQEHFHERITVDDVAQNSTVSRRNLQDRFLTDTRQTISDAITSKRIDHAKKLLTETRSKMQVVARLSGFASGERLSKVFRRLLGISPQEYRDQYTGKIKQ